MADQKDKQDFMRAAEQSQPGVLCESWQWLHHNKKWWLAPILLGLLLVGVLVVLSGTAVAPFIYTLF
jgi:membrane glycosyltransferase